MSQPLNDDDIEPVKPSDVQGFRELLAADSLCALLDCTLIDRARFLTHAPKAEDAALRRVSHRYLKGCDPQVIHPGELRPRLAIARTA